jgi:Phosphoenolpyruvate phosphomutase
VADSNGFADGERIPLALAIDNLRGIVGVTELPVTLDLESGYGDEPELVGESVRLAIEAGAVGCNLEDSVPADGKLRPTADPGSSGKLTGSPDCRRGTMPSSCNSKRKCLVRAN